GENNDRVSFADAIDRLLERLHSRSPVLPIDRNEPRPSDRPSKNRDLEQADLRHEANRLRNRHEDARDVEVAGVIRNQDVTLLAVDDLGAFDMEPDSGSSENA